MCASTALSDPGSTAALLRKRVRLEERVFVPYHLQLQRQIEALVRSGDLPTGSSMPSERELADGLKLSRATVKRSYDELRRAHLLLSKDRRGGTLVQGVPRIEPHLQGLKDFSDAMRELGHAPATRVLERAVTRDRDMAALFGRPAEADFLRLACLRLADGIPMLRATAWYDLSLAPGIANWPGEGSAHAFLREQCGLRLSGARQSIEAVTSTEEEAAAFGFAAPGPCLRITRLIHTASQQPVEYTESVCRGDACRCWMAF